VQYLLARPQQEKDADTKSLFITLYTPHTLCIK
jgi:hypothetical protein